jgi:hypothetical protein
VAVESTRLTYHAAFAFWRTSAPGRSGHTEWGRSVAIDPDRTRGLIRPRPRKFDHLAHLTSGRGTRRRRFLGSCVHDQLIFFANASELCGNRRRNASFWPYLK